MHRRINRYSIFSLGWHSQQHTPFVTPSKYRQLKYVISSTLGNSTGTHIDGAALQQYLVGAIYSNLWKHFGEERYKVTGERDRDTAHTRMCRKTCISYCAPRAWSMSGGHAVRRPPLHSNAREGFQGMRPSKERFMILGIVITPSYLFDAASKNKLHIYQRRVKWMAYLCITRIILILHAVIYCSICSNTQCVLAYISEWPSYQRGHYTLPIYECRRRIPRRGDSVRGNLNLQRM